MKKPRAKSVKLIIPCAYAPNGVAHHVRHTIGTRNIKWNCPIADESAHKTMNALGHFTCRHWWPRYMQKNAAACALRDARLAAQYAYIDDLVNGQSLILSMHCKHAIAKCLPALTRIADSYIQIDWAPVELQIAKHPDAWGLQLKVQMHIAPLKGSRPTTVVWKIFPTVSSLLNASPWAVPRGGQLQLCLEGMLQPMLVTHNAKHHGDTVWSLVQGGTL